MNNNLQNARAYKRPIYFISCLIGSQMNFVCQFRVEGDLRRLLPSIFSSSFNIDIIFAAFDEFIKKTSFKLLRISPKYWLHLGRSRSCDDEMLGVRSSLVSRLEFLGGVIAGVRIATAAAKVTAPNEI
uniref:Uncharacterized protein n=1 Tax=Romanomermis culicivorax TaxID=13658 RepID=A0A915KXA0_ROMCU